MAELCFIRENLRDALRAVRDPNESRMLWIDALCIDQENVEERNHQVGLMGLIYRKAKQIRIWLGQPADKSGRALTRLRQLANVHEKIGTRGLKAIRALLTREYWSRAWIR